MLNSNKLQNVIDDKNDPVTQLGDFRTSQLHPQSTAKAVSGVDPTGITNEEERIGLNTENFSVHYRSSLLWP